MMMWGKMQRLPSNDLMLPIVSDSEVAFSLGTYVAGGADTIPSGRSGIPYEAS